MESRISSQVSVFAVRRSATGPAVDVVLVSGRVLAGVVVRARSVERVSVVAGEVVAGRESDVVRARDVFDAAATL